MNQQQKIGLIKAGIQHKEQSGRAEFVAIVNNKNAQTESISVYRFDENSRAYTHHCSSTNVRRAFYYTVDGETTWVVITVGRSTFAALIVDDVEEDDTDCETYVQDDDTTTCELVKAMQFQHEHGFAPLVFTGADDNAVARGEDTLLWRYNLAERRYCFAQQACLDIERVDETTVTPGTWIFLETEHLGQQAVLLQTRLYIAIANAQA